MIYLLLGFFTTFVGYVLGRATMKAQVLHQLDRAIQEYQRQMKVNELRPKA